MRDQDLNIWRDGIVCVESIKSSRGEESALSTFHSANGECPRSIPAIEETINHFLESERRQMMKTVSLFLCNILRLGDCRSTDDMCTVAVTGFFDI